MSLGGIKKLIGAIFKLLFFTVVFSYFLGFKVAWGIISNFTPLIGFILTGLICLFLGLPERKYGSIIFGLIGLIFLFSILT